MDRPDPAPSFADDPSPEAGPAYVPRTEEERAAYLAAIEEGIADADAGRVIPFEKVRAWLESWGTDSELPPPECE
jgi:predicted transcriptional regulator